MPKMSWRAALAAVPAVLLAYLLRRKQQRPEVAWSEVMLPSQALWSSIPYYYRHPTLPVLTFRSNKVGLGDPATMATITSRFEPRPSDVHIVTYPKVGGRGAGTWGHRGARVALNPNLSTL